jgi:hypothetical protein
MAKGKGAQITTSVYSSAGGWGSDEPQIVGAAPRSGIADITALPREYVERVLDALKRRDQAREFAELVRGRSRAPSQPIATTRLT